MKPLQDQIRALTSKIMENYSKGELFVGELATVIILDCILLASHTKFGEFLLLINDVCNRIYFYGE
jgi:hypothetical protein